MKLIKSKCEKAWLFDCRIENEYLLCGLSCFLGECQETILVFIGNQWCRVEVPHGCVGLPMPSRILNARLALLSMSNHE